MTDQNASTGQEMAVQTFKEGEAYWKERALNAERHLLRFSERLTNPAVCITHIDYKERYEKLLEETRAYALKPLFWRLWWKTSP